MSSALFAVLMARLVTSDPVATDPVATVPVAADPLDIEPRAPVVDASEASATQAASTASTDAHEGDGDVLTEVGLTTLSGVSAAAGGALFPLGGAVGLWLGVEGTNRVALPLLAPVMQPMGESAICVI